MLLTQTIIQKWNSRNIKHYVNLGYSYTHVNDEFECRVEDLPHSSRVSIECVCDYCGKQFTKSYARYYEGRKYINKDCCNNAECTTKKAQEIVLIKYNVHNVRELDEINDKIKQTNINKYGCENPFANQEVKEKIKQTNLQKYGVENPSQNPILKQKMVEGWHKFYEQHEYPKGEDSYAWNPKLTNEERELKRCIVGYNEWRTQVYQRDNYTCQCCHMKRTKSTQPQLNAHHIENFSDNKEKRLDVDNGITLCEICHNEFHHIYGKKHNNMQQLQEFFNNRQKDMLNSCE